MKEILIGIVMAGLVGINIIAEEKYVGKELVIVKYGSEINEVGLKEEDDMDQGGKTGEKVHSGIGSLLVDTKGNIYISDLVNKKTLKYSSNGNYMFSMKDVIAHAVDKEENIYNKSYVKDKANNYEGWVVKKYDNVGNLKDSIQVPIEGDVKVLTKLNTINGKIYLTNTYDNQTYSDDRKKVGIKGYPHIGEGNKIEYFYLEYFQWEESDGNCGRCALHVYNDKGEEKKIYKFTVDRYDDCYWPENGISKDKYGNIYITFINIWAKPEEGGDSVKVYKLNEKGEIIAKVKLNYSLWSNPQSKDRASSKKVVVDEEGSIYQGLMEEDGLQVYKWKKQEVKK